MIFLDTSAIYALADRADPRHPEATALFQKLLERGETLLTHNYVLVESMTLLQHRLGTAAAVKLARSSSGFEIVWVDKLLHEEAAGRLARTGKRRVSLVDHVSFLVMRSRRVETTLAFDSDFRDEGFRLFSE